MSWITGKLERAWRIWSRFWFESDGRAQFRVFRSGLAALLFGFYLIRTLDLTLYFGESGIAPIGALNDILPGAYRMTVFSYLTSDAALWTCNWIYLACLLVIALGRWGRAPVILAFILHVSFIHRNPGVAYGVDLISNFFLLYLGFADYRRSRPKNCQDLRASLGSVAFRLSQIQVCIIYGYSGLHKLKSPYWWQGEALWRVLANSQLARWDFTWVAQFPLAVVVLTYASMLWEIYFPALIWFKRLRPYLLIFGVFMHLGIAVSINIPFFAALMILTYVLFFDDAAIHSLERKVTGVLKKIQVRRRVSDRSYV